MDFLSKLFKPVKSSGSASPGKKPSLPPAATKSEHETYVEFAREFVEELVDSLPTDSTKNIQAAKPLDKEYCSNTTLTLSDNSLDTTLPDLLQPESVYKKQTDTDTDTSHTTEYESAVETDAHDSSSLNDGYVSDEIFECAESNIDQQNIFPQTEQILNTSDHQNLKKSGINTGDLTSTLTLTTPETREKPCKESILMPPYAFEDTNKTLSDVESVGEADQTVHILPPLDISALCLDVANLRLNSTQEIECASPEKSVSVTHTNICESSLESISFTVDHVSADENGFENEFNKSGFQDITDIRTQSQAIHLYETADHELSVIILDQSADVSKNFEINDVLSLNEVGCEVLKHDTSDPSTVTRETVGNSSCEKSFLVDETAVGSQSLRSDILDESVLHTSVPLLPEISEDTSAVITEFDLATSEKPAVNADKEQSAASADHQLGLKVDCEPVSNLTTESHSTLACELLTDTVKTTLEAGKSTVGSATVLEDVKSSGEVSQLTDKLVDPTLIESRPISKAFETTIESAYLADAVNPPIEVVESVPVQPILESTKAPGEALEKSVVATESSTFEPLDKSTNFRVEEILSADSILIPALGSATPIVDRSAVEALAPVVDYTELTVDNGKFPIDVLDTPVEPTQLITGVATVDALVPTVDSTKLIVENGNLPVEVLNTAVDTTKVIIGEAVTVETLGSVVDSTKPSTEVIVVPVEVLDPVVDSQEPVFEGASVAETLVHSVESLKPVVEGLLIAEALTTLVDSTKPSTEEGVVIDSKKPITEEGAVVNASVANATEVVSGEGTLPVEVLNTAVNSTRDDYVGAVEALDLPIDSTKPIFEVVSTATLEALDFAVDCAKPSVEVVDSTSLTCEEGTLRTVKPVVPVEQLATPPVTTDAAGPVEQLQPLVIASEETSFSKKATYLVDNGSSVQLAEPPSTQDKDKFCGAVDVQQVIQPHTVLIQSPIPTADEVSPVIHEQNTNQFTNSTSSSTSVEVHIVDNLVNKAETTAVVIDTLNKSLESKVFLYEVPLPLSVESQVDWKKDPVVAKPTIQTSDPQTNSSAFPENHVNGVDLVTQVIGSGINFDSLCQPLNFGNVAAEAAKVSDDLFNASQEIDETDLEPSLTCLPNNPESAIMADTESTRNVNESIGSVPLDVKWKSESQSALHKSNNTSVIGVTSSNVSTKLSVNGSRDSILDYSQEEDPFKRRSLLQSSPPRDVAPINFVKSEHTNSPKDTVNAEKPTAAVTAVTADVCNLRVNENKPDPNLDESFHIYGEDVFKDPSAFDFLSSVGNSQLARDFRKESLYVKFDPLVGSAPVAQTDRGIPLPPAFAEDTSVSQDQVNSNLTSQRNVPIQHVTPTKNPALALIDRLISLSPSPVKNEEPVKQSPKPVVPAVKQEVPEQLATNDNTTSEEQEAMIEELRALREVMDREDKAHKAQAMQHKSEMEKLQSQLSILQQLQREGDEREQKLNKKIADKAQGQKQMSMIMEEYEKTISRLVAEKEAEHQAHELEKEAILKEKDLALGHLTNIEIAFSDVHMKYERSKNVIEGFKKNEEVLRSSLAEYEATIHKQEQKYDMLKNHAMQQLESANQELDAVRKSQQAENAKLKAMLKKSELKSTSMEEMLEQKIKENQELASICDDLISKVGN